MITPEKEKQKHSTASARPCSRPAGQPGKARAQHAAALKAADQVGDPYQQARAHAGLASACHAYGDLDQARRHWQQANTLYTELGVPEADNVLAHLAALDDAPLN